MTQNRRSRGFTLAEMLIVVVIVIVLMGVAFVAVQNYQRSSTRLEFDTIAKEIFVAAQNHLTEAESQGLLDKLDVSALGTLSTLDEDKEKEVYYLLKGDSALEYLLPAYAVDATILAGSYIIRYQPSSGTVLDMFYSRPGNPTFLTKSGTELGEGDYAYESLMAGCKGDDKRSAREGFGSKNAVIGWYGGGDPIPQGERLRAPTFEVHNEETLWVKVTDPNTASTIKYNIKLIVIGKSSKAEAYLSIVENSLPGSGPRLQNGTDIVLDDITASNMHFADLAEDKIGTKGNGKFIPGEDLEIKAVAYSTDAIANVAMSAAKTTNSLFADPYPYTEGKTIRGSELYKESGNPAGVAGIANFRHLENLDATISDLGRNDNSFTVARAGQTAELSWTEFLDSPLTTDNKVYRMGNTASDEGCFLPVTPQYSGESNPSYALVYDGQSHKVSNVKVNYAGDAGMFGTLAEGSTIQDLELIDFDIKASSGDAGGLIGSATNCEVTKCAAALVVSGSANAGGLIGSSTGGEVKASYSGGHTYSGNPNYTGTTAPDPARTPNAVRYYDSENKPIYNVTGGTAAGGLIGNAGSTAVSNCYSTCSAKGATAGGFVGTGTGSISNSYCTGLVSGTTEGAFAGSLTGTASGCKYFDIINEIKKDDDGKEIEGYNYLKPVGNVTRESIEEESISAFDNTALTYDQFCIGGKDASPYDISLKNYYQNKYNLQTVEQLNEAAPQEEKVVFSANDFVKVHYGDWPAPEEFVLN
ncbi:MAG: prepilin-type N-terminal cleavage/methylation domain-containing protein [Oscillospiraceae bacterium]|nr:prepilin-type N-terminal cleavage/methylation domain-containing protein [Oscillospiraceae bacterium]